ncbi:NADH:flavin oxidoreductase [Paenibacillus radicis (ex Gao et al. 2016)]|uniref:Oxidoreductase n=1 Tax=Paenibacillus radicis (ex Gao et al. 2016) TaxID=1737354 RepID=A0A917GX56_9BACL|nr:NADH:flavin oxidoreductase [Paenibacillus radicis (ex Gao et al. 2016)]GGG59753.1 oxidoreductase [Paenibacillus radicis (ex Gao et al. 2016)]
MTNHDEQHTPSLGALFQPFAAAGLSLANRIVMAPMTRGFSPNGIPGDDVVAYYRRHAENGVGLIVTEGTLIQHPSASASPNWPHFYGEESLNGWKKVAEAVHEAGGKIIPQLWHVGTTRKVGSLPNPEALPVGPSGLDDSGNQVNEPLTESEIADLISAYAQAATDAKAAGFDGIELHGAHGYLIDQFFWAQTNRRTDQYGGDFVSRTRFAAEVIKASRKAVGPDFPIVLRFSQWKGGHYDAKLVTTPEQLEQFLAPLTDAGVDIFHASTRQYWVPEFEQSHLNLAGWTKKLTGKPAITVGSVALENDFANHPSRIGRLADILEQGEADLVAIGRSLLANPEWVSHVRSNHTKDWTSYDSSILANLNPLPERTN